MLATINDYIISKNNLGTRFQGQYFSVIEILHNLQRVILKVPKFLSSKPFENGDQMKFVELPAGNAVGTKCLVPLSANFEHEYVGIAKIFLFVFFIVMRQKDFKICAWSTQRLNFSLSDVRVDSSKLYTFKKTNLDIVLKTVLQILWNENNHATLVSVDFPTLPAIVKSDQPVRDGQVCFQKGHEQ